MSKNYPFNNSSRLNDLIKLYASYVNAFPPPNVAASFGDYIKTHEYNNPRSSFYHVNSICTGILYKQITCECVPDKSIFRDGMRVWDYLIAYKEHQDQKRVEQIRQKSATSQYRTDAESKRFAELEKLPHIVGLKNNPSTARDIISRLKAQVEKQKANLNASIKTLSEYEEYATLMVKQEDHRPYLWSKLRACQKCGAIEYHEFESLCEEYDIDDEMIDYYIHNPKIKYAFKPYIVCKYS